jgi:hypothetical protein
MFENVKALIMLTLRHLLDPLAFALQGINIASTLLMAVPEALYAANQALPTEELHI